MTLRVCERHIYVLCNYAFSYYFIESVSLRSVRIDFITAAASFISIQYCMQVARNLTCMIARFYFSYIWLSLKLHAELGQWDWALNDITIA